MSSATRGPLRSVLLPGTSREHASRGRQLPARPLRLGSGVLSAQASPLRLQLHLLPQQHRVPLQPLAAHLLAGVPEEVGASSALLLDEHFPVLPQTGGRVRGAGRGLWSLGPPARPPAWRRGLTQCPVSRARTSSPDVIFPKIWLMRVLPPKKGCGHTPETDAGERAELGRRRGPFLTGVRAPRPGAQRGRPHTPTAQPELGVQAPGQASMPRGGDGPGPPPSLRPSQAPAVLQEGPELPARVPLLRKPTPGTERAAGGPPGLASPRPSPKPPKAQGATLSLNSSSACKLFFSHSMVTLPPSSMVIVP